MQRLHERTFTLHGMRRSLISVLLKKQDFTTREKIIEYLTHSHSRVVQEAYLKAAEYIRQLDDCEIDRYSIDQYIQQLTTLTGEPPSCEHLLTIVKYLSAKEKLLRLMSVADHYLVTGKIDIERMR